MNNNIKEYIKLILILSIFVLPYFFIRKRTEQLKEKINVTGYDDTSIILFTQLNCKKCDEAQLYIETNFTDVNLKVLSLLESENRKFFAKFTRKYDLNSKDFHSPLICIGDEYMVGWTKKSPEDFQKKVKNFLKK